MTLEQLLALSVKIGRAREALSDLRDGLDNSGGSAQHRRMVDNAIQAIDMLSISLRATHSAGQADEH